MSRYVVRRLLLVVPTLLAATFVCFAITRHLPGGPVDQALARFRNAPAAEAGGGLAAPDSATAPGDDAVARLRAEFGVDRSLVVAYGLWLGRVARFDLGESFTQAEPVSALLVRRLPVTLLLSLLGFVIAYTVCIPLGIAKAVRRGGAFDAVTSAILCLAYALPGWLAGGVLLVLLGGGSFLGLVPLGGLTGPDFGGLDGWGKLCDLAWHAILPVSCYVLGSLATLTALVRGSLIEELGRDYVRTARAKGLAEPAVVFRHALANAAIPVLTAMGRSLGFLLAGSYLVEKVFNIPGMGLLGFEAIVSRDYPVVLGILLVESTLRCGANLLADVAYAAVDPRVELE